MRVSLRFDNGTDLKFRIFDTKIAEKWYSLIKNSFHPHRVLRPIRILNFQESDYQNYEDEFFQTLSRVLERKPPLPASFQRPKSSNLKDLNQAHFLFEELRGTTENPSGYYLQLNEDCRRDLERLNELIHQLEGKNDAPRFVINFDNKCRGQLEDEDFAHFRLNRVFGELCINYCMVGKQYHEVFFSNDSHVERKAVRPMKYYSEDFNVYLGTIPLERYSGIGRWLYDKGVDVKNPRNAVGRLAIGQLEFNSEEEVLRSMSSAKDLVDMEFF